MAVSAKFLADFTQFDSAVRGMEQSLKGLMDYTKQVEGRLNQFGDQFSGNNVITQALLMAEALKKIGSEGKTAEEIARLGDAGLIAAAKLKLTTAEVEQMGRASNEAVDKLQLMGKTVPELLDVTATAFKRVEESTKDYAQTITGLAAALATAKGAFSELKGIVTEWLDVHRRAEDSTVRLTTALRAQGQAIPEVIDLYKQLTEKYSDTTVFSGSLLRESEALLVQIGNVMPEQMDKALQATTDLAAGLRIDLETAARMVGRAMEGNVGPLRRYGIEISKAQVAAQGAAAVFDAIGEKMGGQAAAQAETFTGTLDKLASAIHHVEGAFGDFIASVLNPLIKGFVDLPEPVRNAAIAIGLLTGTITAAATFWVGLGGAIKLALPLLGVELPAAATTGALAMTLFSKAIQLVQGALTFLFTTPVGLAILGAAALAGGLYYLYTQMKDTTDETIRFGQEAGALPTKLSSSTERITGLSANVEDLSQKLDPDLADAFAEVQRKTAAWDKEMQDAQAHAVQIGHEGDMLAEQVRQQAAKVKQAHDDEIASNKKRAAETLAAVEQLRKNLAQYQAPAYDPKPTQEEIDSINRRVEAQKKAREEAERYEKSVESLTQKLGGGGVLTTAKQYEDALGRIGGASQLTAHSNEEVAKAFQAVIDQYKLMGEAGKPIVKHYQDLLDTIPKVPPAVKNLQAEFSTWGTTLDANGALMRTTIGYFQTMPRDISAAAQSVHAFTDELVSFSATYHGVRSNLADIDLSKLIIAMPKNIQSQDLTHQTTATEKWSKSISELANSFEKLSHTGKKAIDDIVKEIANLIQTYDQVGKAQEIWTKNLTQTDEKNKFYKRNILEMAAALGTMAAGFIQATGEGSTFSRTLGGMITGSQIGESLGMAIGGPMGAAIGKSLGAAIGATVGLLRGLFGGPDKQELEGRAAAQKFMDGMIKTLSTAQLAEAGNQRWAQVTIAVRDAYIAVGKSAAEAEDAVRRLWAAEKQGKEAVDAVTAEIQAQFDALQKQNDLLEKYNLTWQDMEGEAQARGLSKAVNDLLDDMKNLQKAGVSQTAILDRMGDKFVDLAAAAVRAGQGIPAALAPVLKQLAEMGKLTQDQVNALLGLTTETDVDFKKMEEVANKYGIKLDSLGPKYQQAKTNFDAKSIIEDFQLLVDNGADVNAVIAGMGDSINKVVDQALTFGTQVPAAMKPVLEEMLKQGKLTDENGNQLEDLSRIQFAKPIEESINDLIAKLDELIGKIGGTGDAFADMYKKVPPPPDMPSTPIGSPGYTIPGTTLPVNLGPNFRPQPVLSFAQGTRGQLLDFGGGTPAILHGKERVQTAAEVTAEANWEALRDEMAGVRRDLKRLPYVMRDAALIG